MLRAQQSFPTTALTIRRLQVKNKIRLRGLHVCIRLFLVALTAESLEIERARSLVPRAPFIDGLVEGLQVF